MGKVKYWVGLITILPLLARAEFPEQDFSELNFEELMQVKVTSVSKKSEKLSEAAAAVYVVTDEQIRRSGATNIPEALRLVPGMDVAQIDTNKWAISIRGFSGRFANKLLVLIDGRSVYTPTYSGVYWEYFDYLMEDIKRIEVIRGPGATLWGANAVNGVINVITREAGENPGGSLSIAAGNEYQAASLRQGGELSEHTQLRGYVKGKHLDESQDIDGADQDNDGDYLQAGFRLDMHPSEDQWLIAQGDIHRADLGQQNSFPDFSGDSDTVVANGDADAKGGNLGLRWGVLTGLDSEVNLRFTYDYYDHQEVTFGDKRDTFDFELQHQFSPFVNQQLIWGGGYRLSENDFTSSAYVSMDDSSNSSKIWNLFIQDTFDFPKQNVTLTLGAKIEDNNYSGSELQPNIRAAWVPNNHLTWWGAISRAMRTPSRADTESTLNLQLDSSSGVPVLTVLSGSDDFQSEQLDAYELGVRWMPLPQLSIDLATFYNNYKNLRSYDVGTPYFDGSYYILPLEFANTIHGHSHGLELLVNWQATPSSRFRFVYNWLEIDLEDSDENEMTDTIISLDEDRALEHQVSLWGSFDLSESLELDARLYYNSERSWEDEMIDAIVDADLRLGWQATPALNFSIVGRNLLHSAEQQFITETWGSVSAIERSVFVTATLRW